MAMDDLRAGALFRAVRHRLGWTQREVGQRARVSQKLVSLIECGRMDELTVHSARKVAAALEIRLPFDPRWRGGDGARLLDADHAALVNQVVAYLHAQGWLAFVEYTFNHFGERGSVDVVGWHPSQRCLLLVEVKSRILDTQETIATLGRKTRVVPQLLAAERGWRAEGIGIVLIVAELTANRSVVARNRATFDAVFPDRTWTARRWVRRPAGRLSALWFLRTSTTATGTRTPGGRKRIRHARARSAPRHGIA